jgi:hypothetical protein
VVNTRDQDKRIEIEKSNKPQRTLRNRRGRKGGYFENFTFFAKILASSAVKKFYAFILTRDLISFQGTMGEEIEWAFKDSIEEFPTWCKGADGVDSGI